MALTTLSGVVSGIRHSTETSGTVGKNGGSVQTGQVLAFRVDNKSVQIKLRDVPDVNDGDPVTVAGSNKNGVFRALALRNDTTGAVYSIPTTLAYVMAGLLILVGFMTLLFLVGVFFLAVGGYTAWQAYQYQQATKLLS